MAAFVVTTTNDSGAGSLRQAILDANAAPGADTISFNLPSGQLTIAPTSQLPALNTTSGAVLDATTQPGFAGTPIVTLDGTLAGNNSNGLEITGGSTTVRGLVIQNFGADQIAIGGLGNNVIAGNYLFGRGAAGGVTDQGVSVSSANNRIGGPTAADRNVISNNGEAGVRVFPGNGGNVIQGNYIGTTAAGTVASPNERGVFVDSSPNTQILGNVISGNTDDGIQLKAGTTIGTVVHGNLIGTDPTGTADVGNGGDGILLGTGVSTGPTQNMIGGTAPGDGNVIAFNAGRGLRMDDDGNRNAILGNRIFANDGFAIDIGFNQGRDVNDPGDADTGPNDLQNYPVLSQASTAGGTTTVTGTLNSTPNTTFRVEFFSDTVLNAALAQGRTFLGFVDVTSDATGAASFTTPLAVATAAGQFATATATDNNGNTSEFSDAVAIGAPGPDIEVSGNGVVIASGDASPSTADLTDFGSAAVAGSPVDRTFTVVNTGQTDLDLSSAGGVTLTGPGAAQFTVVSPPTSPLPGGQQTTFTVRFSPTTAGTFLAAVSVASSDPDENPYVFAVAGQGQTVTTGDTVAPTAAVRPQDQQPAQSAGAATLDFVVRYADDQALNAATFGTGDVMVTGPNGFAQAATFVSTAALSGAQADVVYRVTAPGGTLDAADNGTYAVTVQTSQVADAAGNAVTASAAGSFAVAVSGTPTPTPTPTPTVVKIGDVGVVAGKKQKFAFTEPDGTAVTVTLSGGTGEVFQTSLGRLTLQLTATNGKLTLAAKGGNGRIELADVRVAGSLKTFSGKAADLTGVLSATAALGSLTLGSAAGATISAPSPIASIKVLGDLTSTQVFSGATLGSDGRFGGTAGAADTFGAGSIGKLAVSGAITGSLVAAGLNPVDSGLVDGNGVVVGGAASRIKSVSSKGPTDPTTVFVAGLFPKKAKLGGVSVLTAADPRFDLTP
jgi:parallel beta-helix repeat protein